MLSMEREIEASFQLYKSVGVGVSLLLIVAAQGLFPNRLALRQLVGNWRVNAPLAAIDAVLLSLLCGACVCTWAVTVREQGAGLFALATVPYAVQVALTVVLLDFVAYAWHRANHRWGWLWRFHAVHHSDVVFDASTAFRFHPGELLISLGVRLVVVTVTGLPVLGLMVFELVYGLSNLFVHSDIRLGKRLERWCAAVVVTPSLHRLHHADRPEIHNRNFGTIFSVWDRICRTLLRGDADTPVRLGLPGQDGRVVGLWAALRLPATGPAGGQRA